MAAGSAKSKYGPLFSFISRMPRGLRIFLGIALAVAMIVCMMSLLKACSGGADVTGTDDAMPTPTATAVPSPTPLPTLPPRATEEPTEEPTIDTEDISTTDDTEDVYDADFEMPDFMTVPLAAVIDNKNAFRNISGLSRAQLVYEMPGENGITSLLALFWRTEPPVEVGSIGSCRHYMLNVAAEHGAVLFAKGTSVYARAEADGHVLDVNLVDAQSGSDAAAFRVSGARTMLKTDTAFSFMESQGLAADMRSPRQVFEYSEKAEVPEAGREADELFLKYSPGYNCSFTWDPDTNTYLRWRNDERQMDVSSDKQLSAANVILLKMDSQVIKDDPDGMVEVEMTGEGIGWYLTGGMAQQIRWSRAERDSATDIRLMNGEQLVLNPGRTWIVICPNGVIEQIR